MGGGVPTVAEKRLTGIARKLRRVMTEPEKRLWSRLRGQQLGNKFVRQFPIGNAVADFACRSAKLVVELDGARHVDSPTDLARTRMIEAHGYTVIRFWNTDVLQNTDGVVTAILQALEIARNR